MTNWYSIFYWLTVADGAKSFLDYASNIFTFFSIIAFAGYIITSFGRAAVVSANSLESEEEDKTNSDLRSWELAKKFSTRLFYPMLILSILTWTAYVMVPTKKDCLLIIAGGAVGNFMSTDSSAKQLPSDVTKFLHMSLQNEIKELGVEARKEFGMQTPNEKLIDKVQSLTKEQIIQYLKTDTTIIH